MGIKNFDRVYVLHHTHQIKGYEEDVKLLGIFSSEEKAIEAIEKYKQMPGFKETPEGFSLDQYVVNKTEWREGFITE